MAVHNALAAQPLAALEPMVAAYREVVGALVAVLGCLNVPVAASSNSSRPIRRPSGRCYDAHRARDATHHQALRATYSESLAVRSRASAVRSR